MHDLRMQYLYGLAPIGILNDEEMLSSSPHQSPLPGASLLLPTAG